MFNYKNINITPEAYNALLKQRKGNETLSDTIIRLTKNVKTDNSLARRIIEAERKMPTPLGESWFTNSDLL